MLCSGYTKVWELAPNELVKLDGARGTTLRVTYGTVWITQQDDTRDVVLSAGDVFTIDRGGLTLVEAQGKTTVCVLGHPVDEIRAQAPRSATVGRIAHWLRSVGAADHERRFVPYF